MKFLFPTAYNIKQLLQVYSIKKTPDLVWLQRGKGCAFHSRCPPSPRSQLLQIQYRGGKGESRHEHSSRVSWYVASRTLKIQLKPCQAPEKLHYLPWIQPVESMWCKQLPWGHFFQGLSSMALISQPPLQQSPVRTCTSETRFLLEEGTQGPPAFLCYVCACACVL